MWYTLWLMIYGTFCHKSSTIRWTQMLLKVDVFKHTWAGATTYWLERVANIIPIGKAICMCVVVKYDI